MSLPFFYTPFLSPTDTRISLDEDTSRHVIQVLRMKTGELLHLTDGRGQRITAAIAEAHKKQCIVTVTDMQFFPRSEKNTTLAVSLLKQADRFEWLLEKATEIGVRNIIPLLCKRTEREKFRYERAHGICISAMLQSQQCWLPELSEPVAFGDFLQSCQASKKLIAHCEADAGKRPLSQCGPFGEAALLIGPEGDFTPEEIAAAQQTGWIPVSLGSTRLRTETAALLGAVLLQQV